MAEAATLTKYIVVVIAVFGVGISLFVWYTTTTHTVLLTEKGFTPAALTVKRGDVVAFKTERAHDFWPASNEHPAHTVYPAFDANKPIAPLDTWQFRFEKVGTWEYHDHLYPFFEGTITVTESERE